MDWIAAVAVARGTATLNTLGQIAAAGERLEKGFEPRRFPARGGDKRPVEEGALAVSQGASVRPIDEAAGR